VPLLTRLRAHGIRLALASASRNATTVLEKLGVATLFDGVVDGNAVSQAKPEPEIFLAAAALLDVDPAHCVVFEDAVAGVEAAERAGMFVVGVGPRRSSLEPTLWSATLRVRGGSADAPAPAPGLFIEDVGYDAERRNSTAAGSCSPTGTWATAAPLTSTDAIKRLHAPSRACTTRWVTLGVSPSTRPTRSLRRST